MYVTPEPQVFTYIITGRTFYHKEEIKEQGGTWDKERSRWILTTSKKLGSFASSTSYSFASSRYVRILTVKGNVKDLLLMCGGCVVDTIEKGRIFV